MPMKQIVRSLLRHRAALMLLGTALGLLGIATPAAAQHPCPAPGPNERIVGTHNPGPGQASYPICVWTNSGPTPSAPQRVVNTYAAIVWHHNVQGVWLEGNFSEPNVAEPRAMAACQRAMGDGCVSVGEWQNSDVAIARDWNGSLYSGWGRSGGEARQSALDGCKREQPLPCEVLGTYGSDRGRVQPSFPRDLKAYGAAASPQGPGAPNPSPPSDRAWIATGHASEQDATAAAVAACQQANPGQTCLYFAVVANGVIQTFSSDKRHNALPERNAGRAVDAVRAVCSSRQQRCRPQIAYDSRRPGLFVHNFETGERE